MDLFDFNILSSDCQDKINRLSARVTYKEHILLSIEQVYNASERLSADSKAFDRYDDCGKYMLINPADGKIIKANFCRQRLCPVCNYIKSTINWHKIKDCVDCIKDEYHYKFIFMTLTVRNCSADKLNDTIDDILQAFRRLTNRRTFKHTVKGGIRGLEITYNKTDNTYHPHIHFLAAVPNNYFDKTNDDYITIDKLREWWQVSAKLDYFVQVDIRGIDQTDNAVAEVAKYAIKMSSLLDTQDKLHEINAIKCIYECTYKRRLIATLGCFKTAMQTLGIDDFDTINDCNVCRTDKAIQCIWTGKQYKMKGVENNG